MSGESSIPPSLRAARADELERLTEVFVSAFMDDPIFVWVLPDPRTRADRIGWLARRWLRARAGDQIMVSASAEAMLVGVAPDGDADVPLWAQIQQGLLAMPFVYGLGAFRRFRAIDADVRRRHAAELDRPSFVIDILAVEPAAQGRGLGTRLVEAFAAQADRAGAAIYLVTHNPRNLPFYRKLGFAVVREAPVPPGLVVAWSMRRPAPK